jgi:hypothetical protein
MTRLLLIAIGLVLASCAAERDRDMLAGPNAFQHLAEGRPVDIPPALAKFEPHTYFKHEFGGNLVLPGRRAAFRAGDRQPTFFSIYPGPDIRLFRLKRGDDHDDRNLKVAKGPDRFIPSDVMVELEVSREGDGLYRVTPRGPLPPGEYAFMSRVDTELWHKRVSKARLYPFGVD